MPMELDELTLAFVRNHLEDDVRRLALGTPPQGVNLPQALRQIAGYQIARKKIPSWAAVETVCYPPHLSLEQCSSEDTARYKAGLACGKTLVDLTGGMGVDCFFMASRFESIDYVERQSELCDLARYNFAALSPSKIIRVHEAQAESFLHDMERVDCIYLDPARRDSRGGKTVAIADCSPDVSRLEPFLLGKATKVLIKLSPMLDIRQLQDTMKHVSEIHVVSVGNECKEIVAVLEATSQSCEATIRAVDLSPRFSMESFAFTLAEEQAATPLYADEVETYLYEPFSSLLKAGAFGCVAVRLGCKKLHKHSHLYTSAEMIDFPGRRFRVEAVSGFGKKERRNSLPDDGKANLTVRNFPERTEALRKKLKLTEGGDTYLFATTLHPDKKILIRGSQL